MRIPSLFFRMTILSFAFLLFWYPNTAYGVDFKACECEVEIEPSDQEPETDFFYGWTNDMEAVKNVSAEFKYVPFGAKHQILLSSGEFFEHVVGTAVGACGNAGVQLNKLVGQGLLVTYECNESDEPPEAIIQWGKNVDDKENPIRIKPGEIATIEIEATSKPGSGVEVVLTCDKCGEATLIGGEGGKGTLKWDTSKTAIKPGNSVVFDIIAADKSDGLSFINGKVYVFLEGCADFITAADNCDDGNSTIQENCRKKCEVNGLCKWDGGECKDNDTATDAVGTVDPADASLPQAQDINEYLKEKYPSPRKTLGWEGALPDCAFRGDCRNVNDLLELIINFGKGMFMILGSFAFAFFVYGGFTMIISMGNAEKQKKGQQMLIAAVIGLIIAFSAYTLIKFMLDAIVVGQAFRGIN